jgi:hypothetical protein
LSLRSGGALDVASGPQAPLERFHEVTNSGCRFLLIEAFEYPSAHQLSDAHVCGTGPLAEAVDVSGIKANR